MRFVRTGRATEVVEVYDTTHCRRCGSRLAAPTVLIGAVPCGCSPGGHRSLTCRARADGAVCGEVHLEPPCTTPHRGHGSAYDPDVR